jgi:hypothetical protein
VQRLKDLFERIQLNNAMNGVIRRDPLQRALRMGNFRRADILLMAELALLGKYVLLDDPLFFRRISPEAASSRRSEAEADKHIIPDATKPLLMQHWKYQLRTLRIALRNSPRDRSWLRLLGHSLRKVFWARSELVTDLFVALKRVAG